MATVAVERNIGNVSMRKQKLILPRKSEMEIFKEKTARIMREDGASENLIANELTDNAVAEAILNHFTPESLAWALLQ